MNCPKYGRSPSVDDCDGCEFHVFDYRGLRCSYESNLKDGEK